MSLWGRGTMVQRTLNVAVLPDLVAGFTGRFRRHAC
jgi:hypothetical protein